jgi:bacteriorhodopsin
VGISVDTTGVGNNVSANTVGSTSGNSDWVWFVAGFVIFLAIVLAIFLVMRNKANPSKKRKSGK